MKTLEQTQKVYNEDYFRYQRKIGEFGGWANKDKFQKYITSTDKVIDFGCGGGYLLKQLNCGAKIGIEVNESARQVAKLNGIKIIGSYEDVPDEWADIIISNHVLEHTSRPLDELIALRQKLKPGGKIIFVVPSEGVYHKYKAKDLNHHLYTWSPMCLGNLFESAGYNVLESKSLFHRWPPKYRLIAKFGKPVFNTFCKIYGYLTASSLAQSRVVAIKT
ncbi:hypothetical protein GCM10023189_32270 [Nibrella saemangeumensis]|uniref:Methyltransferase domain-containing protein n=1 Tax=Nibrella saemangeumensis TaxID=1084526 RepID=A0ABP8N4G4_9BACT